MKKLIPLLALTLFSYTSSATVIYVDTTATGNNDGTNWTNAYTALQPALDNSTDGDTVWVAKGTYLPTEVPDGAPTTSDRYKAFHIADKDLKIFGGFDGTETMLSQRNWQTNPTLLSGDFNDDDVVTGSGATLAFSNYNDNAYKVFINVQLTNAFELDGFTIRGSKGENLPSYTYATASFDPDSGGVDIFASHPTFKNLIVTECQGGGVKCRVSFSSFENCQFSRCIGSNGGGLSSSNISTLYFNNAVFSGNIAYDKGAGMYNESSTAHFTNVTFSDNYSINGGGLTTISSTASLSNVTFSDNEATWFGGGMYDLASTLTIKEVAFFENTAGFAGGGAIYTESIVTLTNTVFTDNTAPSGGGAAIYTDGGQLNLHSSTVYGNSNGVVISSTSAAINASLTNTILYNNSGSDLYLIPSAAIDLSMDSTLLEFAWPDCPPCNSFTNNGHYSNAGVGTDPLFANTSDLDGPDNLWMTADDGLALQASSPILSQGNATGAPATDIAGTTRPSSPSIGAYQVFVPPCTPGTFTQNPVSVTICENDSLFFSTAFSGTMDSLVWQASPNGTNWASQGTQGDTLAEANTGASLNGSYFRAIAYACNGELADSTTSAQLFVNAATSSTLTETACTSYSSPSGNYTWTSSGSFMDTIPNTANCDSIITVNLTINQPTASTETVAECLEYFWDVNNTAYTMSGMYTATIPNSVGCDSVITLDLTVTNIDTTLTFSNDTVYANQDGATYQWLNCLDFIPAGGVDTEQYFVPTLPASYAVDIMINGCSAISSCHFLTGGVGVDEYTYATSVNIYPNPFNDMLTITVEDLKLKAEVTIRNVVGQEVLRQQLTGYMTKLNLNDQIAGIYVVEVRIGNNFMFQKLVKE